MGEPNESRTNSKQESENARGKVPGSFTPAPSFQPPETCMEHEACKEANASRPEILDVPTFPELRRRVR